jgi:hypothetical protein
MFDRLMRRHELPTRKVIYGHRRYRRAVILAAALHQAGIDLAGFQRGTQAGFTTLDEFVTADKLPNTH